MEKHIYSYPSIYNLGHKNLVNLFDGTVYVEEKVDGSQISFGVLDGELHIRSKRAEINVDAPEGMFSRAVEATKAVQDALTPNAIYRGEYLQKPKHNALVYSRVPKNHIIIFDICLGIESYFNPIDKLREANYLGFECVPLLYSGEGLSPKQFQDLLETESILGGQKIEGVVIKNYSRFGIDKKVLIGKYVSERFKEVHKGEWRKDNPTSGDIIQQIIVEYRTPARWQKAVIHLQEQGEIEDSPRDIGKLILEIPEDIRKEHEEEIKQTLFNYAWPKIRRGVTAGMPDWYKELLTEKQFEGKDENDN